MCNKSCRHGLVPCVAVTENCEATMKGLMLYRYPQDFDVMIGTGAEPQNFKEQEVGTILTVTPTLIRTSEKFFDPSEKRRRGDLNPRIALAIYTLSRGASSAT